MELLEKRVKSRFSHRQILLFPLTDFDGYVGLARTLLSLPDSFEDQQYRRQWQEQLEVPTEKQLLFNSINAFGFFSSTGVSPALFSLQKLLQNSSVLQALQRQFRNSANVRSLKTLLVSIIIV